MSKIYDLDLPKSHKKVIARFKGDKKEAAVSKGRSAGPPPGGKGLSWYISQGFRLKIQILWIIVIGFALLCIVLLFLGRPDKPENAFSNMSRISPSIKKVYITPEEPRRWEDLLANIEGWEKNRDKTLFRYVWYKNNEEIKGVEGKSLSNSHFDRGDLISVKVVPVMNAIEGRSIKSSLVEIRNCPPVMQSVVIEPEEVYTNTDLRAEVYAEDQDHDEISFLFQWIKNGMDIQGQESEYLMHSHFDKGDQIQIQVTPFDGYNYSMAMITHFVIVNNSPPKIISRPPSTLGEGGTFVYKVLAEDIDNDSLKFFLSPNNPPGITIDPESGLLFWKIPHDLEPGPKRIEIIVNDIDGCEATQWFSLNIQFVETQG